MKNLWILISLFFCILQESVKLNKNRVRDACETEKFSVAGSQITCFTGQKLAK